MKKTKLWTLLVAIIVFMVGIFTVEAASNIEATGISIKDQSSTMTVDEPTISNGEITSNITFKEVGDYVLFDITLKNNKSSEYKIKSVTDNNENESIEIEYDYDEKIGVGGTGSLKIKMTYKNKSTQDVNIEDLVITIEEEDGSTDKVIVNPKTSDNILRYVLLLLVSMMGIIFTLVNKKTSKALLLVAVAFLMIPTIVFASEKFTLKFLDIEVKAGKYTINYDSNGGSGEMVPQAITYNAKANLTENEFTNGDYPFKEWNTKKDGSGDSYGDGAEVENLTTNDEITLYAIWGKIALLDTGEVSNAKMKNLANNSDEYDAGWDEFTIQAIKRSDTLPDDYEITEEKTISDESSENPIYIFFDEDTSTVYWYTEADLIYLNSDSSRMFEEMEELRDASALNGTDSSKVTSIEKMFYWATELADFSFLEGWKISGIDSLAYVFTSTKFSQIDLIADWDVSEVTTMESLFYRNQFTTTAPLANWNTSNVTDMSYIFSDANELADFSGLENWDTSNVTSMYEAFSSTAVEDLTPIGGWDVSKVESMAYMFQDCSNIQSLEPLSGWVTDSITSITHMFNGCSSIESLDGLESFDISNVGNTYFLFAGCNNLKDIDAIGGWNVSNLTSLWAWFLNCDVRSVDALAGWDVGNVTSMDDLFGYNKNLTSIDALKNWNTSKLTDISDMLSNCSSLESVDFMNYWDTRKLSRAIRVFSDCSKISGTMRIMSPIYTYNSGFFSGAATAEGTNVVVNYTSNVTTIDTIIATKSADSHITKGSLVTYP